MELEVANNGTKEFYVSPCYYQEKMVKIYYLEEHTYLDLKILEILVK